jgi:abhydrolase domain-containing protein 17
MGDMISTLLFQPPIPTYLHPSRHFWLTNEYGIHIPAFYIERPSATVTILFSHGNAEDLGMIYDWFNDLSRVLRVNIMAYDYTGYGKSTLAGNNNTTTINNSSHSHNGGTAGNIHKNHPSIIPSEQYCYADIEAAYRYLTEVRNIHPEQIVLYGRSLGSGPSCYLAAKTATAGRSVGGVILQSPLLSAYRVAFNFRYTMMGDRFPNIDYASSIRCPVFILHGTQDEVVPFWHGQELFLHIEQEWRAKPFWVTTAGHNNIEALLRPSGMFVTKLMEYLDFHIPARKGKLSTPPIPVPECIPNALREYEGTIMTNPNTNHHHHQQQQQQQLLYTNHHPQYSTTKTTTSILIPSNVVGGTTEVA